MTDAEAPAAAGDAEPALGSPGPQQPADAGRRLPAVIARRGELASTGATDLSGRRPPYRPVRRDARVGAPPRSPQWMLNQLPVGMMEGDFFVRFAAIFQELGNSLLDGADLVEHVADVTVTPAPLLPHLASWIGVGTVDASIPEALQRVLVSSSARALAWRGTRRGIVEYLQMLSGGPAEVDDSGGVWPEGHAPHGPGWVRMRIQQTGHLSESELVSMVRDEIPAHVRAELWVGDRRIWSSTEESS